MNMQLERMTVSPGLLMAAMCASMLAGCKPEKRELQEVKVPNEAAIRESAELPLRQSLAEARLALAIRELDAGLVDHALLHAVSSLETDPLSAKARAQVAAILTARAWALSRNRKGTSRMRASGTKLGTGPVEEVASSWVPNCTASIDSRSPPKEPE